MYIDTMMSVQNFKDFCCSGLKCQHSDQWHRIKVGLILALPVSKQGMLISYGATKGGFFLYDQ